MTRSLLQALHVNRHYGPPERRVHALQDVTLQVDAGAFVAIVGPSGCGKSTLLHLCGGMDRPSSGEIRLGVDRLDALGDEALARVRRDRIGFVFQSFNLLPTLTAGENIAVPLLLAGVPFAAAERTARACAGRVGIADRFDHYPRQLSGGEMQRTALARAVVHEPALLIADEPTGNLDSVNGARVIELLQALNREAGVTILLATHASDLAAAASRVVRLHDGRVVADSSTG